MKPTVSVLLPFLNGGVAFEAALASILSQSFIDWELLLCDDGSSDSSLAVAKRIGDRRVRVWSDGTTKGLAPRLNECIDQAQGRLLARMDADDLSYPDRFLKQVEYLHNHPEVDVVGCQMLIFTEQGEPLGKRVAPASHEAICATPSLGFGLAHPTWMARAEWYRKFRYNPDALRYEDAELLYRSYATSRFANLPEVLYGYREMSGGLKKRFRTRLGRVKYLVSHRADFGSALALTSAVAESAKVVLDAAITLTGQRYRMLRAREESLSLAERSEWQQVLEGARLNRPVLSDALTTVPGGAAL
jgi:glycosyltransferase involved in cell wall biosynthesis